MASDLRRQSSRNRTNDTPIKSATLNGRAFLLEVENRNDRMRVAEGIMNAGGSIIDSFDEQDPLAVISDHAMASRLEKDSEVANLNERTVRALPALLREAVRKKIKVRTPDRFLRHLHVALEKKNKASSATNSNSTMRPRPTQVHTQPLARGAPVPVMRTTSAQPSGATNAVKPRGFLRIDCPGRKPEVRTVDPNTFSRLFCGMDSGHSVFKGADQMLMQKRQRDYNLFLEGKYEPSKKQFKLDEKDSHCQFCSKSFTGDRREHEKTEEHRQKAKGQGLVPTLERIVMNVSLKQDRHLEREESKKRRDLENVADKRAAVEFEYGENEFRVNWEQLRRPNQTVEELKKLQEISPRRRQKRIRYSPEH